MMKFYWGGRGGACNWQHLIRLCWWIKGETRCNGCLTPPHHHWRVHTCDTLCLAAPGWCSLDCRGGMSHHTNTGRPEIHRIADLRLNEAEESLWWGLSGVLQFATDSVSSICLPYTECPWVLVGWQKGKVCEVWKTMCPVEITECLYDEMTLMNGLCLWASLFAKSRS